MYEGIQEKRYINSIMQNISAEISLQRELKLFKETQKMYDQIIKDENLKRGSKAHK